MVLPEKIEIQLNDNSGSCNALEHVLMGLKIFVEDDSYHNYSDFKTDKNGKVVLTRKQIIDNTELKWEIGKASSLKKTKFEIYIWDGNEVSQMVQSVERLLKLYKDEEKIVEDLRKRGITGQSAETAMNITRKQSLADLQFYEFIQPAINEEIRTKTRSITGFWLDDLPKQYQIEVNLIKNTSA